MLLKKYYKVLILSVFIIITSIIFINNNEEYENTSNSYDYFMILEIPKLNIKKEIYDKDNLNNNIDKNITILDSSDTPDIEHGNVILASHNGNTKVSYFKHLNKLNISDKVYLYYKGIKYTYEVYKIDTVDKTGTINININKEYNNLILISCKNGTKDKQLVYLLKCVLKSDINML